MVKRVFPGPSDFENLSRVRTEASREANDFDYSRVVVRKPWGYEYLWFQNPFVAVWMLQLTAKGSTSLHCHARKRTSLVLLRGAVLCSTIDDRYPLTVGSAIVFEPCAFHSTEAVSAEGALVMEVETPPLKGDLVRLKDRFGRAGQTYETASEYSRDLDDFDYQPLSRFDHGGRPFAFGGLSLRYCPFECAGDLERKLAPRGLAIPLGGRLIFGHKVVADVAEAILIGNISLPECPPLFPPVELLQVIPP